MGSIDEYDIQRLRSCETHLLFEKQIVVEQSLSSFASTLKTCKPRKKSKPRPRFPFGFHFSVFNLDIYPYPLLLLSNAPFVKI